MKYIWVVIALVGIGAVVYLAHGLEDLNNTNIINTYLDNHCEKLENQAQTWYECNKESK